MEEPNVMPQSGPDMNNPNSVEQQVYDQQIQQEQASQAQNPDQSQQYAQIAAMISDLDRRLRTLEERYSNLRKKLQLTDQNFLESEKSFSKELKNINQESLELKRGVNDFSDKLAMFGTEMENVAQKTDMKVLEKYMNMWAPANFVTRTELKEYLKSKKEDRSAKTENSDVDQD